MLRWELFSLSEENNLSDSSSSFVRLAGWAGLIGALLVGVGEFSMQYTPNGGIEDVEDYFYFNDVSPQRLSFGHFLAVLLAPFYVMGYWFLSKQLEPASRILSRAFFLIGAYAFAIGTAWIGQRFYLATTVHEIAGGQQIRGMLVTFSEHNEPFVNILRVAMLLVSAIWVWLISTGKTTFPRWMAIFSPILLLALMFVLYFFKTTIGLYVFPAAMNVTHFIIFSLALCTTRKSIS